MKSIVYADLQATSGGARCFKNPLRSLQEWRVETFFRDLYGLYVKHECNSLWDLGDTMDDRSLLPVPAIDTTLAGLDQFPEGNHLKLTGNHEQVLKNTLVSNSRMFTPYFTVADQPTALLSKRGGCRILLAPFPASNRDLTDWIDDKRHTAKDFPATILLGHFQTVGSATRHGVLLEGVSVDCMDWVDLALLGHIHKPQSLTDRIHYVGSPFEQNWGEAQESKRVAVVDTDTLDLEWVSMDPFGYPRYLTVTLDQFEARCTEASEDRYKVCLTSQAEADRFYANPLAARAEATYDYALDPQEVSDPSADASAWDFESVARRWMKDTPIEGAGINYTVEEMMELAVEIRSYSE